MKEEKISMAYAKRLLRVQAKEIQEFVNNSMLDWVKYFAKPKTIINKAMFDWIDYQRVNLMEDFKQRFLK